MSPTVFRLIPAHAGKTWPRRSPPPPNSAHPRSRGENGRRSTQLCTRAGSSPLTRGKQAPGRPEPAHARLIPAHAGKTARERRSCAVSGAHPRSRGENAARANHTAPKRGSSPLTRGKRVRALVQSGHDGLIPAHAGKTPLAYEYGGMYTAHPRSRGENLRAAHDGPRGGGSSPLTRGKPPLAHLLHACLRLIPAHAGKTARGP